MDFHGSSASNISGITNNGDSIRDSSTNDNSNHITNDHSNYNDHSNTDHSNYNDHSNTDHSNYNDHSNTDHSTQTSTTSNHTRSHAPNPLPPSLSDNMNVNARILSNANTISTDANSRIRRISHPLPPSHEHTNAKAPILPFTNHGSTHTHLLDPAIPSHTNDPYTRPRDLNKENNRNRRANRSNRSNRRATRPNDDSDSERSRSRDRRRNVSSRRELLIPSFQNVEEIDKMECINIYMAVYETESTLPSNIIKEIAEYAIGVIYVCDNYVCSNEILTTNSTNYGGYYANPQALVQNEGNVDVNQSLNVFCNSCYNGVRQCSLHFTPFVLQDEFHQNIFIFNGSNRQSLSEMVNFKNIYCSNRFMNTGMNTGMKYCNQCIAGRQVFIGNYCINIACDTNYKKYSIGAESHTYYNYGGHSHENVGGQGGINIHNNVRRARNYNYM